MDREVEACISSYKKEGKKPDQAEIISLLREIQDLCGGVLTDAAMEAVCAGLDLKYSYLNMILKYLPDLKTEAASHRLQVCSGKNCSRNDSGKLQEYIEQEYQVKNGEISKKGRFAYSVCGCMKNCKEGPNVKWDGEINSKMTIKKLDQLIGIK